MFEVASPEYPGMVFSWNFGANASPATNTGPGPHTVQYSATGSKTITVTATYQSVSRIQTTNVTVISCPGNIAGTVKRANGTGLTANLKLFADNDLDGVADNATVIRSVNSNSSGAYNMINLLPGSYVIVLSISGYHMVSGIDITDDGDLVVDGDTGDNIIPVTIGPSEIDSGNNFIVDYNLGIISGSVKDNLSNPIEGAEINIYADSNADGIPDGPVLYTAFTDASGNYSVTGVSVQPSGSVNYVIALVVPAGYVITSGIDISNDSDVVANIPTNDEFIPCTLVVGETDADNRFIITAI